MKPFLREIGKLFNNGQQKTDKLFYGVVKDKITTNDNVTGYKVSLGGESATIDARKFAGAEVGDTVMLCKLANGSMIVLGRKDGDADALEALDLSVEAMSEVEDLTMHFWYDNQGAHVKGDQTSYQTDITSNGLTIKNNGVAVSSFKDGEIKLGVNDSSNKSSILLASETFEIDADLDSTYGYGLMFKPRNISENSIQLQTYKGNNFDAINSGARITTTNYDGRTTSAMEAKRGNIYSSCYVEDNNGQNYATLGVFRLNGEFLSSIGAIICTEGRITLSTDPDHTIVMNNNHVEIDNVLDVTAAVTGASVYTTGEFRWKSNLPSSASSSRDKGALHCMTSDIGGYFIGFVSSSKFVKNNIKNVHEFDCTKLYDIPVRQYVYNEDDDADITLGLIADEVAEHFPVAAIYRKDFREGKDPADWSERIIIPAMLKLIQDQHKEIEELKARVNALENKNE